MLLPRRHASTALCGLALLAGSLGFTRTHARVESDTASLSLRVVDARDVPLIARVRVIPSWTLRALVAGSKSRNHVVPEEGLRVALVPGSYRLVVSHGPEWSIAELPLELAPREEAVRTLSLTHQVQLPAFRAADLHVHTLDSEDARARGGISARDLRAEGIELAARTDHNRIGKLEEGIASVPGAEITTWAPEIGHFNAFPLKALPRWRGTTPAALFAELRKDPDVFVQVNHPRLDDHIAYFSLGGFDGREFARPEFSLDADGVEIWNGYQLAKQQVVERLLGEWRGLLALGKHLTATGGSDSHGTAGHLSGYPRTYVRAERAEELAPALKRGQAFVTNGPLLELRVNGAPIGETVRLEGKADVELSVLAPDWMQVDELELWADDERVWRTQIPARAPGEPLHHRSRIQLSLGQARTLQAVARGGSGLEALLGRADVSPLAFTNPVYLVHTDLPEMAREASDYAASLSLPAPR